jgi:hypothetical protein
MNPSEKLDTLLKASESLSTIYNDKLTIYDDKLQLHAFFPPCPSTVTPALSRNMSIDFTPLTPTLKNNENARIAVFNRKDESLEATAERLELMEKIQAIQEAALSESNHGKHLLKKWR